MTDFSSATAARITNLIPIVETMTADLLTPLAVYLKLSSGDADSFLLESVAGGESLARYSFIGAHPELIVSGNAHHTITIGANGEKTNLEQPLFDSLRKHFSTRRVDRDADLPSFVGGAIGFFGFSCVEWFHPSLKEGHTHGDEENAAFMIFRSIVAFDHAKQLIKIITLIDADDSEAEAEATAKAMNRDIRKLLESSFVPLPPSGSGGSETVSNWERNDFESAVDEIKDLIRAGECYQVVLSQRFTRATSASDVSLYRALRSLNPSPYMFLLRLNGRSIIGASPEMLVKCEGDNLEYRPIAGTRPRGKSAAEDNDLAEEMKRDQKELSEHIMLVDLGRNDLGRVADFGSVEIAELMKVERYSHVQHLVSSLKARLAPGNDRFDALAACFPAGTVSGAPKIAALRIIRRLEPTDRGIYSGAVGYFDYSGNMDTCITIRTLVLEDGVATVQAGAGIVADSIAALEYEETVNKASALLKAIDIAEAATS